MSWPLVWTAWIVLVAGCATPPAAGPDRIVVVATISIIADMAGAVAGDFATVESIVGVGGDPHTYEPVPSDARLLTAADVVFTNGLGLERWLDTLVATVATTARVVAVGEPGNRAGSAEPPSDPHRWMDPVLAISYVKAISDALADIDPVQSRHYQRNAESYIARLDTLDREIAQQIADVPRSRRKLVTSHDAFAYFGERYGLAIVGSVWGITTEREPSAREVSRLVDSIRRQGVPVIFIETTINPKLMVAVARDAGVQIGAPLYGDSVGAIATPAATYIGMMRANTAAIVAGLAG